MAIVEKGDRFRAYVSDATPKGATLSVWFRGDIGPDGHVRAVAYGVGLEVDLERRDATGAVTLPDGRTHDDRRDRPRWKHDDRARDPANPAVRHPDQ